MYRKFIKNIVMAEKYRYEAFKELLPEPMKKRVQLCEKEALKLLREMTVEIISEENSEEETQAKKKTKKVDVDFC